MTSSQTIVKRIRASLGLTLEELAKALGRNEKTIRRWESGETEPRHSEVEALLILEKKAAAKLRRKAS